MCPLEAQHCCFLSKQMQLTAFIPLWVCIPPTPLNTIARINHSGSLCPLDMHWELQSGLGKVKLIGDKETSNALCWFIRPDDKFTLLHNVSGQLRIH